MMGITKVRLWLGLFGALIGGAGAVAAEPVLLSARSFGLTGDGVTDDGPALARAVEALRTATPPATLRFEAGKTYRIKTAPSTWVFELRGLRDFTLDGNGSTFVLAPHLRFVHLNACTNATVRGFSLDFDPLPFADGTVVTKNATGGWVDVKIHAEFALPPLGGPTGEREQAYFAMLWRQGPHSLIGNHYFLRDTQEAYPGSLKDRVIRAFAKPDFRGFAGIRENVTRISLPVRGIAHKVFGFGASPAVVIEENDRVTCERINLWSAPLFAVNVARNRGECVFRRFDIRPKPGTARLTSSWRDGFHVKANYASLLFEDCHLEGMNDDSFNTATHSSQVMEALSPTEIRIRQNFQLGFVPFNVGDVVGGFSVAGGQRFDAAKVTACAPEKAPDAANPNRPAVPLKLTLDRPLAGIAKGDIIWNESSANPRTIIRRCKIFNSCRFQSPVTIEDCDITAFCWFYGDNIEGPLPREVVIRNSRLRQGRGNPDLVASFTSLIEAGGKRVRPTEPVLFNVRLENNTMDGELDIGYVANLALRGNRFVPPRGKVSVHDSQVAEWAENYSGTNRVERP
jgi:hypothetical protein